MDRDISGRSQCHFEAGFPMINRIKKPFQLLALQIFNAEHSIRIAQIKSNDLGGSQCHGRFNWQVAEGAAIHDGMAIFRQGSKPGWYGYGSHYSFQYRLAWILSINHWLAQVQISANQGQMGMGYLIKTEVGVIPFEMMNSSTRRLP